MIRMLDVTERRRVSVGWNTVPYIGNNSSCNVEYMGPWFNSWARRYTKQGVLVLVGLVGEINHSLCVEYWVKVVNWIELHVCCVL